MSDKTYDLNRYLGMLEYTLGPLRDWLFFPITIAVLLGQGEFLMAFLLFPITIYSVRRRKKIYLEQALFGHCHRDLGAHAFFDALYVRLGPFPAGRRDSVPMPMPLAPSPKKHRSLWPMLRIGWDTCFFAQATLLVAKHVEKEKIHEVFDSMAEFWGKRALEHLAVTLQVEGKERLAASAGKVIFIFNHLSQLDFMLGFLALSQVRLAAGRRVHLRFVVAKDHFKDNWFVYRALGVGAAIEQVGMVFVERKQKGKGYENLRHAAVDVANAEINLGFYPQGTRAWAHRDESGEWRDGGYYTTFSKKTALLPLGHLKRGLPHFMKSLAQIVRDRGEGVALVPVGIQGTGKVLPRGHRSARRGGVIRFSIGEPLAFTAEGLLGMADDDILSLANHALIEALDYHRLLRERFLGRFGEEQRESVESALGDLDEEDSAIVYPMLDRLYGLSVSAWKGYEERVRDHLLGGASRDEWLLLLERISERV